MRGQSCGGAAAQPPPRTAEGEQHCLVLGDDALTAAQKNALRRLVVQTVTKQLESAGVPPDVGGKKRQRSALLQRIVQHVSSLESVEVHPDTQAERLALGRNPVTVHIRRCGSCWKHASEPLRWCRYSHSAGSPCSEQLNQNILGNIVNALLDQVRGDRGL